MSADLTHRFFLNFISGNDDFSQSSQNKSLYFLNHRRYDRIVPITAIQEELDHPDNCPADEALAQLRAVWFLGLHEEAEEAEQFLLSLYESASARLMLTPPRMPVADLELRVERVVNRALSKLIEHASAWFGPNNETIRFLQIAGMTAPAWGHYSHPLYHLGVRCKKDVFALGLTVSSLCSTSNGTSDTHRSLWIQYVTDDHFEDWMEEYKDYLLQHQDEEERRLAAWAHILRDTPLALSLRMRLAIHLKYCTGWGAYLSAKITDQDLHCHDTEASLKHHFATTARIIEHFNDVEWGGRVCELIDYPLDGQHPGTNDDDLQFIDHDAEDAEEQEQGQLTQPPTPESVADYPGILQEHFAIDPPAREEEAKEEEEPAVPMTVEVMARQWMVHGEHPLSFVRTISGKQVEHVFVVNNTLTHSLCIRLRRTTEVVRQQQYSYEIGPPPSSLAQYIEATRAVLDIHDRLYWCKIRNRLILLECSGMDPRPLKRLRYDVYADRFGSDNLSMMCGTCCCCLESTTTTAMCRSWENRHIPHFMCVPCFEKYKAYAVRDRKRMDCPSCREGMSSNIAIAYNA